ncbi:hypothetical protein [Niallia circulans]|uniref:hypothetical protein n=1 Tax=Niallia circulans TaxID=1397 RepID=UPI00352DB43F
MIISLIGKYNHLHKIIDALQSRQQISQTERQISQSRQDISQTERRISQSRQDIIQIEWRISQRSQSRQDISQTERRISQSRQQISQTSEISAKAHNKSAKPKSIPFSIKTAKDKKTFG